VNSLFFIIHISVQEDINSLAIRKGVALFKMTSMKKVAKGWPRNGCDGIGWWQVNLCCPHACLIPASLGISTKFT